MDCAGSNVIADNSRQDAKVPSARMIIDVMGVSPWKRRDWKTM
jgi:hypothetical protein